MSFKPHAFAIAFCFSLLRLCGEADAQSVEAIAKVPLLGDMALGATDAPVTIVEYTSLTCPHCAAFMKEVFPKIKTDYIDTGKVRFIFREFPLEKIALAGSAMARCLARRAPSLPMCSTALSKQRLHTQ